MVSSGGAGEDDLASTGAGGAAGVTGKGSSSWSWEAGGPGWLNTTMEGEVAQSWEPLNFSGISGDNNIVVTSM